MIWRSAGKSTGLAFLFVTLFLAASTPSQSQAAQQSASAAPGAKISTAFFDRIASQKVQLQASLPLLPNNLYFPIMQSILSYSISGRIIDSLGYAMPGITVTLSTGQTAVSNSQGYYAFTSLPAGAYTYSANGGGSSFSPIGRTAILPPDLTNKNFTRLATTPVSLLMAAFYHSQRTETKVTNACGPAALLTNLEYFGINAGNLDQVILATSLPPEAGGFDPICYANPVCLSAGVLANVARSSYNLTTDAHDNWTFDLLYSSLARGNPVIALVTLGLTSDGIGHFVTVYGADPTTRIIYYHDPFYGPSRSASWNTFYNSWSGPVDVGDPIQPAGHRAWGVGLSR